MIGIILMFILSAFYAVALYLICCRKVILPSVKVYKNIYKETGFPILTLKSNNKEFNFILDTGSNRSYVKKGVIEEMDSSLIVYVTEDGTEVQEEFTVSGAGGSELCNKHYMVKLEYNGMQMTEPFTEVNINESLEGLSMEIHGLIGTTFLAKYNYVIDFNNFVIYQGK